jgi:hypothetical protein
VIFVSVCLCGALGNSPLFTAPTLTSLNEARATHAFEKKEKRLIIIEKKNQNR